MTTAPSLLLLADLSVEVERSGVFHAAPRYGAPPEACTETNGWLGTCGYFEVQPGLQPDHAVARYFRSEDYADGGRGWQYTLIRSDSTLALAENDILPEIDAPGFVYDDVTRTLRWTAQPMTADAVVVTVPSGQEFKIWKFVLPPTADRIVLPSISQLLPQLLLVQQLAYVDSDDIAGFADLQRDGIFVDGVGPLSSDMRFDFDSVAPPPSKRLRFTARVAY